MSNKDTLGKKKAQGQTPNPQQGASEFLKELQAEFGTGEDSASGGAPSEFLKELQSEFGTGQAQPIVSQPQQELPEWTPNQTATIDVPQPPKGATAGVVPGAQLPKQQPEVRSTQKTEKTPFAQSDIKLKSKTPLEADAERSWAISYLANDYDQNVSSLSDQERQRAMSVAYTDPKSVVSQITNPHGDPNVTSGYVRSRIAGLEAARKREAAFAAASDPGSEINVNRKYDALISDLRKSGGAILDLQLFAKEYSSKQYHPEVAKSAQLAAFEKYEAEKSKLNERLAEIDKWEHPSSVQAEKARKRIRVVEMAEAQKKYEEEIRQINSKTKYNPVLIGAEKLMLLGGKEAKQDYEALLAGRPINPENNYTYQDIGRRVIQFGIDNTQNENAKKEAAKHADVEGKALIAENLPVLVERARQVVGNKKYNDENPLLHSIVPSGLLANISKEDIKRYAEEEGFGEEITNELLKDPGAVPKSASLVQQIAKGGLNFLAPSIYSTGMRVLGKLYDVPEEKMDEFFRPGWQEERGLAAKIAGNMPSDQNSFRNIRGALGLMAETVGMMATFGPVAGEISKGISGATGIGEVGAERLANAGIMGFEGYNNAYNESKEIVGDNPEDEGTRQLYSLLSGVANGAIFSIHPPSRLVKAATGEMVKSGEQLVNEMRKVGLKGVMSSEFTPMYAKYIREIAKAQGIIVAQADANLMAQNALKNMFSKDGHKKPLTEGLGEETLRTYISFFIPTVAGGVGAARSESPLNRTAAFEVATDAQKYRDFAKAQLAEGKYTESEYRQALEGINILDGSLKNTPVLNNHDEELTPNQVKEYSFNLTQDAVLRNKVNKIRKEAEVLKREPDKAQLEPLEKKISELEKRRSEILNQKLIEVLPAEEGKKPEENLEVSEQKDISLQSDIDLQESSQQKTNQDGSSIESDQGRQSNANEAESTGQRKDSEVRQTADDQGRGEQKQDRALAEEQQPTPSQEEKKVEQGAPTRPAQRVKGQRRKFVEEEPELPLKAPEEKPVESKPASELSDLDRGISPKSETATVKMQRGPTDRAKYGNEEVKDFYVTEEVARKAYDAYAKQEEGGHVQSYETIIRRGGFGVEELNALVPEWKEMMAEKEIKSTPSEEYQLFDVNDVKRPNGSIGTQGVNEAQAKELLESVGVSTDGLNSLKEIIDHLKANPSDREKLLDFTKKNPIEVTELPDGSHHIEDGHHRATLLYYSGEESVPARIKNAGEYNKKYETKKLKTDASTRSKEQQQKGPEQGGKPEHEGAEQARDEAKTPEAKDRDSNIGGEEEEKIKQAFENPLASEENTVIALGIERPPQLRRLGVSDKKRFSVRASDVAIGGESLESILDAENLSDTDREDLESSFERLVSYSDFDDASAKKMLDQISNPEDIESVLEAIEEVGLTRQSDHYYRLDRNTSQVKEFLTAVMNDGSDAQKKVAKKILKRIKEGAKVDAIDFHKLLNIPERTIEDIARQYHADKAAGKTTQLTKEMEGLLGVLGAEHSREDIIEMALEMAPKPKTSDKASAGEEIIAARKKLEEEANAEKLEVLKAQVDAAEKEMNAAQNKMAKKNTPENRQAFGEAFKKFSDLNSEFERLGGVREAVEDTGAREVTISKEEQDAAKNRRKEGKYTVDGIEYVRNEAQEGPVGSEGRVQFSDKEEEQFEYMLIEADQLQPSHVDGRRNPNFFIPEAQPKERSDEASILASDRIGENPDIEKVGASPNAYSGAPVVNERGEIVQGNNRGEGLKKHYRSGGTKYKKDLAERAAQFGLTSAEVESMDKPILVRRIKGSDEKAIRLGNYMAASIETGGKRRVDPVSTARRMSSEDKKQLLSAILSGDDEKSMEHNIGVAFRRIFQILRPYLNPAEIEGMIARNGDHTPSAIKDVEAIVGQMLFEGGRPELPTVFDSLSNTVQRGILKALPDVFGVSNENSLVSELQNAIIAFQNFDASGMKWSQWMRTPDIFKGSKTPDQIFTPLELALAEMFSKAKKQEHIYQKFKEYASKVNGIEKDPMDMFGREAVPGIPKAEAIKEVFNVEGYEQKEAIEKPAVPVEAKEEEGLVAQEAPAEEPTPAEAVEEAEPEPDEFADSDKRLAEIAEEERDLRSELQRQLAAQKQYNDALLKAEREKDIDGWNKQNENLIKKEAKIAAINEKLIDLAKEERQIETDRKIAMYKRGADRIRRFGKDISKGSSGMLGVFPAINTHLVKPFINAVAEIYQHIGNLDVAISKAIDKFVFDGLQKGLTKADIRKIRPALEWIEKPVSSKPKLSKANEEIANEYVEDILDRDVDFSMDDAVQEIAEMEISDTAKAKLIDYIKWETGDRERYNAETLREPQHEGDFLDRYELKKSDKITKYLTGETQEDIFGQAVQYDLMGKETLELEDAVQDAANMIGVAKHHYGTNDVVLFGENLLGKIANMREGKDNRQTVKKILALSGLHNELHAERVRTEEKLTTADKADAQALRGRLRKINQIIAKAEVEHRNLVSSASEQLNAARAMRLVRNTFFKELFAERILNDAERREKAAVQDALEKTDVRESVAEKGSFRTKRQAKDEVAAAEAAIQESKQGKLFDIEPIAEKEKAKGLVKRIKDKIASSKNKKDGRKEILSKDAAAKKASKYLRGGTIEELIQKAKEQTKKPC